MIKIEGLTKCYGNKNAVENLSLQVNAGELFGFIGPNGAGKTTTLKAISGILDFDGGDIFIMGCSIKTDPIKAKRNIAYIPDNPDIYSYMKGIDYLNFIADIYGTDMEKRGELIGDYAAQFEILDVLNMPIGGYSHGMKQKLAIISALIHSPKVLILDEPFVGLDPKASHTLKQLMRKLCDEGGCIFFSTHVLEVAQSICDKIAIIKQGKLVVQGDTHSVCSEKSLEEIFMELV
ncbi:MAG: ABC transporter ATP-binding protein [Oscillospiraceae bacterium]